MNTTLIRWTMVAMVACGVAAFRAVAQEVVEAPAAEAPVVEGATDAAEVAPAKEPGKKLHRRGPRGPKPECKGACQAKGPKGEGKPACDGKGPKGPRGPKSACEGECKCGCHEAHRAMRMRRGPAGEGPEGHRAPRGMRRGPKGERPVKPAVAPEAPAPEAPAPEAAPVAAE